MWPVQVLQRAATALFLHTAEPELAEKLDPLAMMERALEGVWPGCTGACHQWRASAVRVIDCRGRAGAAAAETVDVHAR